MIKGRNQNGNTMEKALENKDCRQLTSKGTEEEQGSLFQTFAIGLGSFFD